MNNSTYDPYHKPDNKILYIDKDSNSPPNILKQIQTATEKRNSSLSSNETIFKGNAQFLFLCNPPKSGALQACITFLQITQKEKLKT